VIEGVEIFPSLPHLNFLSLLIVACQRGASEFFIALKKQYAEALKEVPWDDVLPLMRTVKLTWIRHLRRLGRFGLISEFQDNKGI
jgi:Golgi to ER traffic protein 4